MIPLLKLCLLMGLAVGASAAIGIPISMTKMNQRKPTQPEMGNIDSLQRGKTDVSQVSSTPLSIDRCSDSVNEKKQSIEFGEQYVGNVCWDIESETLPLNSYSEYSSFFKNRWGAGDHNWNMSNNQNQWTQQCFERTWVLLIEQDNGEQYLGLCGPTELSSTKFIKKKKEVSAEPGGKSLTLSLCDNDCWDLTQPETHSDDGQTFLTQENESKWKKVLFYRN